MYVDCRFIAQDVGTFKLLLVLKIFLGVCNFFYIEFAPKPPKDQTKIPENFWMIDPAIRVILLDLQTCRWASCYFIKDLMFRFPLLVPSWPLSIKLIAELVISLFFTSLWDYLLASQQGIPGKWTPCSTPSSQNFVASYQSVIQN